MWSSEIILKSLKTEKDWERRNSRPGCGKGDVSISTDRLDEYLLMKKLRP